MTAVQVFTIRLKDELASRLRVAAGPRGVTRFIEEAVEEKLRVQEVTPSYPRGSAQDWFGVDEPRSVVSGFDPDQEGL